jgi:Zn-dependent protease with chaperone function
MSRRKGEKAVNSLVHPRERVYFALCVLASLLVYVLLVVASLGVGLLLVLVVAGVGLVLHGWSMGHIRGNGVRISAQQLPEVDRIANELAKGLGLSRTPAIYVIQQGGALNAFATKFIRRDFVVIYSDMLELAYQQGEDELAFVLAHELAHVRRRHVFWHWLLAPARWIPPLGQAYSRACEYTCDRMAAHLRPAGAPGGLLVLASGKRLYRTVNPSAFVEQGESERGFWVWFAEVMSSHPRLPKRIQALEDYRVRTELLAKAA